MPVWLTASTSVPRTVPVGEGAGGSIIMGGMKAWATGFIHIIIIVSFGLDTSGFKTYFTML